MESQNIVKLIQLEDKFTSKAHEFPYVLSIKSKIRFRLRSKMCFGHQPAILIEKLQSFDYMLPLNKPIDIAHPKVLDDFIIIKGRLTEDGAWEADLPPCEPGVISFQLVFVKEGTTRAEQFGTCEVILLCQDKFDLRKLRSMTVFPRCIGPVSEWLNFFLSQKAIGYNTFHLAPIQQTGASNSYYSLKNHLQLSDYLFSGSTEEKNAQLKSVLEEMKKEGMVFFIDIILNHTSFDSEWIRSEPDAVYTIDNTPMLYPSFLVDSTIFDWGEEVKEMMSFDTELTEEILTQIEENLTSRLNSLDLVDYFQLSPDLFDIMLVMVPTSKPSDNIFAKDPVESIEDFFDKNCTMATQERLGITVRDLDKWIQLNLAYEENDLTLAIEAFNNKWKNRVQNEWIPEMIRNTMNQVRHNYFDNSYRSFDDSYPFVNKYFSRVEGVDGQFYALNNGWIGGNDSRQLFVIAKEYYYLRRQINVWGDLIRIRYGNKPSDSPAAWEQMLSYVREMAKYFDGFRMDNLHGTPLYVAQHMIKEARKVNPNLIVFAELFTSSQVETASFVRQIGINSTLKEAQHLLNGGAFVYQFHKNINFISPYLGTPERIFIQNGEYIKYASYKHPIPLVYDLTHDNETYATKDILVLQTPVSFLLSMIGTFTGTTKGYDQFYSKKIQVTELKQLYSEDYSYPPVIQKSEVKPYLITFKHDNPCEIIGSWNHWKQSAPLTYDKGSDTYYTLLYVQPGEYEYKFRDGKEWILDKSKSNNGNNQILRVPYHNDHKSLYRNLQPLRKFSAETADKFYSFKEYHVFNYGDIVIVIREPVDHLESICVIANLSKKSVTLSSEIILTGNIIESDIWLQSELSVYEGLTTQTQIAHSKNLNQFFQVIDDESSGNDKLRAPFLPPGFSCIIHCKKNARHREMIMAIDEILQKPVYLPPLGPLEINGLFFSCSKEEEHLWGQTNYAIPQDNNHQLVYGGFGGVFNIILRAKRTKNLGEGLYSNLREGNWLMDFFLNRCRRYTHLSAFVEYLQKVFGVIGSLPRYLVPKYFSKFIYSMMLTVKAQSKLSGDFERSLHLSISQFINYFPSCSLTDKTLVAAGLPHFAVGWSRCWGRDTFTSSDLLRVYPNIFRESILQFASAMRHGLIPNLLDQGRRPRYNCRDACWWFIRSIGEYIDETKDYEIFKNKVQMIFYSSDKLEHEKLKARDEKKKVMILEDIVQEIIQRHALGIVFREWNSGYEIDPNMTSEGFNISLEVDSDTGFIVGGNSSNCLTWMDKMGSSTHAVTKGVPSTPRAGAPVELVGLLYVCLMKLQSLHKSGHYSYEGVQFLGRLVKFEKWTDKIAHNFDRHFFLKEREDDDGKYARGIYKDLVFSPLHYDQERFRCNALITLAIAPELCNKDHAKSYIKKVQEFLIRDKSIGVGSLSEHHTIYCPYYDNNDDSSIPKTAHGFSYHNGPEWVWLYGFYLTAKINFQRESLSKRKMMTLLQNHIKILNESEWQSFPELTNVNGEANYFSCKAQTWSVSSILLAMRNIKTLPDDK